LASGVIEAIFTECVCAIDPKVANSGVDARLRAMTNRTFRRNLRRKPVLLRQPHPFRYLIRPLKARQFGAMQVLRNLP